MEARMTRSLFASLILLLGLAGAARADVVLFTNGDRLTGTVTQAGGGKMTIKTETAGTVVVDLSKVKTFSTTRPVELHVGDKTVLSTTVAPGPDGSVTTAPVGTTGTQTVAIRDVTRINPPPVKWTGTVTANGSLARGNSSVETVGVSASAVRRSEQDRITLGGGYQYGRQEDPATKKKSVTADYLFLLGKYDHFFTRQLYGYAGIRMERDKVADLELRLTPSAGAGYQWVERPTLNVATEAGIAWIYEDFRTTGSDGAFAGRLAYHIDWRPFDPVLLFHNLEWIPAFESPTSDFLLNADAGARVTLAGNLFAEAKAEWRHDATPAPGRKESDWRYLLGVGWSF
jgi:putative salt-induced outer membrane protein